MFNLVNTSPFNNVSDVTDTSTIPPKTARRETPFAPNVQRQDTNSENVERGRDAASTVAALGNRRTWRLTRHDRASVRSARRSLNGSEGKTTNTTVKKTSTTTQMHHHHHATHGETVATRVVLGAREDLEALEDRGTPEVRGTRVGKLGAKATATMTQEVGTETGTTGIMTTGTEICKLIRDKYDIFH